MLQKYFNEYNLNSYIPSEFAKKRKITVFTVTEYVWIQEDT